MRLPVLAALLTYSFLELIMSAAFVRRKQKTALKSAIGSLVFVWLIFFADFSPGFHIPDAGYLLLTLSFFTDSLFGYYLDLYSRSQKYDRVQHAFGAFSFAIFLYFFFGNFFQYGGSKTFRAFYVMLLGIFIGMLGEIMEFLSDLKNTGNEPKMQKGLKDTDVDMISDIVGSLSAGVLAYYALS